LLEVVAVALDMQTVVVELEVIVHQDMDQVHFEDQR
tara:strand:+ start:926 stop:1033 length:108 start_codon:yes stop_codon:yes gene_type:complete